MITLPHRGAAAEAEVAIQEGLSSASAEARLRADGPNELPGHGRRSLPAIAREVLTEPMFLLLIAAASIYLILGDTREALALSSSLLVIIAITILQERRTEQALAKLRDLSGTRATVVRDGRQLSIPTRELVTDDLILLNEGDRVPADARLLSATALSVDESLLTGESLPIDKQPDDADANLPPTGKVFSGTLIVRGHATAVVTATGARSEIGRIGKALVTLQPEITPLFHEVRQLVRRVAAGGLLLCALIAVLYAITRDDWLSGILAGITVAMGVLPEEFPVILTIFLAMGAWRISRSNVLTRRMPAIESIGAATVLAVDKTGTLTENRMRVAVLDTLVNITDLRSSTHSDETATHLLFIALAASERDAFDPMEHAIHDTAQRLSVDTAAQLDHWQLIREYDLTPELLAVTHVWQRNPQDTASVIAVKGAPETVFDLCRIDNILRSELLQRTARYAHDGLRVLAVAQGTHATHQLPDSPHGFELQLLGLLCLADPLRSDVPANLLECRNAGIRVVMITGDHAGTALAIARQAGLDVNAGALTGAAVAALNDEQLHELVDHVNVYARMTPEHKLRLVQALKHNGEVVVMTGDGVNDAPALKAAHVGVAMGGRGTEVARAAASLVLVNDDFASLVGAVRLGRRIYDNIRHAMCFIIAVHIPIAGLGLFPVLFGWPLLLFPLHVMFMEFVVDPACSFVFEADEAADDIMRRKPRAPDAPLFNRPMVVSSVLRGTLALLFTLLVYWLSLATLPEGQARALAFMAMIGSAVALIFISRTHDSSSLSPSRPPVLFWWITGLTYAALLLVTFLPAVAVLFQFERPPAVAALLVLLATPLYMLISRLFHLHIAN